VNSPEDGPVGPKHVEIRRYMNKIEMVTSVGFSFHTMNEELPDARRCCLVRGYYVNQLKNRPNSN
jgi:hypothetical protein